MNSEKLLLVCFSFVFCHDSFRTLSIVTRAFFTPRRSFRKIIAIYLDNNRLLTETRDYLFLFDVSFILLQLGPAITFILEYAILIRNSRLLRQDCHCPIDSWHIVS